MAATPARQGPSCDPESRSIREYSPFHIPEIGSIVTLPDAQYSSSEPETTDFFSGIGVFSRPNSQPDFCCPDAPTIWLGPTTTWEVGMSSTSPVTSYRLAGGDPRPSGSSICLGFPRKGMSFYISFKKSFIDCEYLTKICRFCQAEEGSTISISRS